MYILTRSKAITLIMVYRGKVVNSKMFDNLKEKTNKKFDDRFRKNGVPVIIKIDDCSIFSDPKIAELMVADHR